MIQLETDRLILRDYKADDFEEYFRLMSDDRTMYYLQDLKQSSIDAAHNSFNEVLADIYVFRRYISWEWSFHKGQLVSNIQNIPN